MTLSLLLPEAVLVLGALLLLTIGITNPSGRGSATLLALAVLTLGAFVVSRTHIDAALPAGMVIADPLSRIFKMVLLFLGGVTVVLARDSFPKAHFAEALALILFSITGMLLLTATENLLMIFVALELTSIPLYVLAAFDKRSRASAEAGLKYFLVGSVASAFLLYGLSLIYGATGSLELRRIAASLSTDSLLAIGIIFALGGFAFKIAAVPFQLWAPDVYEGAPTSAAALVASGSKVAGVFILVRLLSVGLAPWVGSANWEHFVAGWAPVLAVMAATSIILGNLAALIQSNVKRLLAYSAIAHAGYMLLALAAPGQEGLEAVLFYVIIYAITAAGAFGVVAVVEKQRGDARLDSFDGLAQTAPGLAACLLVFLISLAGIPPLAGFFGKFYLFASALSDGSMLWLVVVAIALNAVSLYYYLIVLKHAFVMPAPPGTRPVKAPASKLVIALLAAVVVAFGIVPDLLLKPLLGSATSWAMTRPAAPHAHLVEH